MLRCESHQVEISNAMNCGILGPKNRNGSKIVGGSETIENEIPWQVAKQNYSKKYVNNNNNHSF